MGDRNRTYLWWIVPLVFGIIIGWFILGWLIAPVSWNNASLQDLDPALKEGYVVTAAEAYAQTQDGAKVVERLQALGSQADVAQLASDAVASAEASGDLVTADRVRAMAAAIGLPLTVPDTPAPAETDQGQESGSSGLLTALGLLLIIGGIVLAAWLLMRRRSAPDDEDYDAEEPPAAPVAAATTVASRDTAPVGANAVSEPPGQRFRAEFNQGDRTFDESFDIEGSDGTYLGECGVTISETVDGDPDRATALEVWLFDKSDIRTVTKVLMSDYAYGNPPLREKLSSRGDAVLLGTGIGFVLDAQTLRLAGKVIEMEYDQSIAPPSSTVRHMLVELRVIQQPPAG
ncbi:MAG: hypothetical protein KDI55_21765 [Anaerolineae bacterium]|nr:hypothetical protein [Anaerolineae bacterium]